MDLDDIIAMGEEDLDDLLVDAPELEVDEDCDVDWRLPA